MLPVKPITVGRLHGLRKDMPSNSGNPLAPFCGSTAYVSMTPSCLLLLLMVSDILAGSGKSILWYVSPQLFVISCSHFSTAQPSSKTSDTCVRLDYQHLQFSTLTFEMQPNRMLAVFCLPFSFNSAINPIIRLKFSFPFIRPTPMAPDSRARMRSWNA